MINERALPSAFPDAYSRAGLLLAALASLFCSGVPSRAEDAPPEKVNAEKAPGEKAVREKAPGEKAVGESDPRSALRKGDYQAALEGFRKVAESASAPEGGREAPEALAARRGWAEALGATGKYEEALGVLESGSKGGSKPALSTLAASILIRTGKLEEARAALEKAPPGESDPLPVRVEWMVLRGRAASLRGKLEEAQKAFTAAIDLYKEMDSDQAEGLPAETFVHWALALVGLNRFGEAESIMFSQAEEKDPKCVPLLLERGRVFLAKYNFPDSRDLLKEAIAENPRSADALAALAENYLIDFTAGPSRFEEAEKSITGALEVNSRCAEAYLARGQIWLYDGNYQKAALDLERALAENPALLRARGLAAACHRLQGEKEKFAAQEEAARAINPRGAEFYHTIAVALDQRFRYYDAVAMTKRALELDPEYWPAFVTLGINCLRTGENALGRTYLDKSWEKDRYNLWVFNTRRLLAHMDKNYTSFEDGNFVFYFPKEDSAILSAYLVPLLKEAQARLEARYRTRLPGPVQVENFSEHQWFSARTVGLPGFPASGACFGRLVTLTTPKAIPQNWGAVAWHEFAHVAALALTEHRVPRWLTEGLSVYEEGLDRPHWARNFQRELADAWASRRLLPLAELDFGFSRPKYPDQILISYFQGCMIVRLIVEKWSFDKVLEILNGYRENRSTPRIIRDALGIELEEFDRQFDSFMKRWVEGNGYRPRLSEEMVPLLEAQVEKDPQDLRALADLAWAYLSNGNEVDASLTASRALELDPACGDAQAVAGLSSLKDKKTRAGREALEKALKSGTAFAALCHAQLGSLLARDKDSRARAIEHFEEAKRLSPVAVAGHPARGNAYYQLAKLYEEDGKGAQAHQQMVELARFAVEDAECRVRIARYALEVKKDPREAMQHLDQLMYIDPFEPKFHRLLARAATDAGDHDIAIRENQVLLGFPDTNPRQVRLALARAFLKKGDKARAAAEARRLLQIDPEHEEARELLRESEKK